MISQIIKRDGSVQPFNAQKIVMAITKAGVATDTFNKLVAEEIYRQSIEPTLQKMTGTVGIEEIQDLVEKALFNTGFEEAHKAFVLYRDNRKKQRESKKVMVDVESSIDEYITQSDWRVNANANQGYSLGGMILNVAGKVTANYWLSYVYPEEVGLAHRNGDYHIHDLDMLTGYCCGHSLRALLNEGFNGVANKVESAPPKHLSSALMQMVNFLGSLQNEWSGAQAFSSFDTYLAPFVRVDKLSYAEVKQAMQEFIFSMNAPSRWGCVPITTEVLTTKGWKNYQTLKEGDFVYSFGERGQLLLSEVKRIIRKKNSEGKLVRFYDSMTGYEQLVTTNHRVIIKDKKYQIKTAEELLSHYQVELPTSFSRANLYQPTNSIVEIREKIKKNDWILVSSEEEAKVVQQQAIIEGYTSYLTYDEDTKELFVRIRKYATTTITNIKEIDYDGEVWCPSVTFGTVVFRDKNGNVFISGNTQTPFTNLTFDLHCPDDLRDQHPLVGGEEVDFTYGELQEEMDMLNRAYIEIMTAGDSHGRVFTFPIPTYNITKDFDWNGKNTDLLFEMTAKYGLPYFQNFTNSDLDPHMIRSMCPLSGDTWVRVKVDGEEKRGCLGWIASLDKPFAVPYGGKWHKAKVISIPEQDSVRVFFKNGKFTDFGVHHLQPVYRDGKFITIEIAELLMTDKIPFDRWDKTVGYVGLTLEKAELVEIERIQKLGMDDDLYCFEVENSEHLFVLNNGLITHNCRLRLDLTELLRRGNGLFGSAEQTGSVGVVTINCARLGYLFKHDKEGLYKRLDYLLELAKTSLELKRKTITRLLKAGLYPYTKRYIGSYRNFFSTIGVNGVNEMIRNFTEDTDDITTDFGHKMAVDLLNHVRDKVTEFQKETGNMYNIEASPAEGCTHRFAKEDIKRFPDIIHAGTDTNPYYTNSTQLPVNYTDDPFEALEMQEESQCLYTGGCIEKGNYVITNKGRLLIEDIVANWDSLKDNLEVVSYNVKAHKSEWKKVTDAIKIDVSKHDKIHITGERGLNIVTSDWHPFFVVNKKTFLVEEKRADELQKDDWILQNKDRLVPEKSDSRLTFDTAYLIGYFMGNGSMSATEDNRGGNHIPRTVIRFHDGNKNILARVSKILNNNFETDIHHCTRETDSQGCHVSTVKYNVADFFKKYGFKAGRKCYTVGISEELRKDLTNQEVISGLLSGFIDSDGYIEAEGDLEYSTVSERLAQDIVEMFNLLGVIASYKPKFNVRENEAVLYRVRVCVFELSKIWDLLKTTTPRLVKGEHKKYSRQLPVVRVQEVSKTDVQDNQFYDLTVEDNHNYLCGKQSYVFIHNTVLHLYMNERISTPEMCKQIVKRALTNYRLPYITITPTFSICPKHGYIAGEHKFCPKCDEELIAKKRSACKCES